MRTMLSEWLFKQKIFEKWYISSKKRSIKNILFGHFVDEWWNYTNMIFIKVILRIPSERALILDVGSGEGRILVPLVEQGIRVVGLDPSSILLKDCKEVLRTKGLSTDLVRSIGECLPFRDDLFDIIICAATLEHLFSPELFLKEAKRVLKNGGVICIKQGFEKKKMPQADHIRSFTIENLLVLVRHFKVVAAIKIGNRSLWRLMYYLAPFIRSNKILHILFRICVYSGMRKPEKAFLAILIAKKTR